MSVTGVLDANKHLENKFGVLDANKHLENKFVFDS